MRKALDKGKEWLGRYKENDKLKEANIFHMYQTKKYGLGNKGMNGYHDAKLFELRCYNSKTLEFRILQDNHDAFSFNKPCKVKIFVDGSTMLSFEDVLEIPVWIVQHIILE